MLRVVRPLLYASRFFSICAVLAGLAGGLLEATLVPAFICVDSCSPPAFIFAHLGSGAALAMAPCVALEAVALVLFLIHCAVTRQPRRAITAILVFVAIGLLGVATLNALLQQGQNYFIGRYYYFEQDSGGRWLSQWGHTLMVVSGVWSGVLAYLQWDHRAMHIPARHPASAQR